MDMVAIMATIILVATLATLIFAFAAYFITKAKRKRTKKIPSAEVDENQTIRTYFERYIPGGKMVNYQINRLSKQGNDTGQWT